MSNANTGDVQSDFNDIISHPLTQAVNGVMQLSTYGVVGYGKDGVKLGAVGAPVGAAALKGVKDITGATAAEQANQIARDQFNQQTATADKAQNDAITLKANQQLTASNSAGAASKNIIPPSVQNKVGDTKDFLGL
jgi:hypothetical protein